MTVSTAANQGASATAETTYERFAGVCAILAGIAGFLYSVGFIILRNSLVYGLFQLLGGLLATAALVAVYNRLREVDAGFSLWAIVLGLVGALGSAIHGGYDLANAINPPASNVPALADLPSQIDPRGVLTFGVAGLSLVVIAWLMLRGGQFPRGLGYLGYLLGALFIILYLGRLVILNAASPAIVGPALLAGFIVNPVWYIWLGLVLRRGRH
ncbi:MAG: hypothetical protein KIS91_18150 [Anaerolineae bacterium]|nr:hypothetical protein [Anaerolineae bacterium]